MSVGFLQELRRKIIGPDVFKIDNDLISPSFSENISEKCELGKTFVMRSASIDFVGSCIFEEEIDAEWSCSTFQPHSV